MQILLPKRTFYSFAFIVMSLLHFGTTLGQGGSKQPVIISATQPNDAYSILEGSDIIIEAGGILTMNADKTFASITTRGNGSSTITGSYALKISGNITLGSENTLVLNTNGTAAALQTADLNGTKSTIRSDNNSVTLIVNSVLINAVNGGESTIVFGENISVITANVDQGTGGNNSTFLEVSGTLKISGDMKVMRAGAKGIKTVTCHQGSTIEYSGSNQIVYNTEYYNLALSGSGAKTISNLSKIKGNLTMAGTASATATVPMNIIGSVILNENATFNTSSFSHTIGGDWINNNSNFNAGTSTVTFNGSSVQSIKGENSTTFKNLTISNTSTEGITLNQNVNVDGILTLESGQITIFPDRLLTLNNLATVSGGSNSSFVNGPVKKIGFNLEEFKFPVGKDGKYLPIGISAAEAIPDAFTAAYYPANAAGLEARIPAGLASVSNCEYWDLQRVSGTSKVNVTLYWNTNNNNCTGTSYFSDPASITVAHYNGNSWNSFGGSVNTGSTENSGSITWIGVSEFSPFTFGKMMADYTLPVHFSNVRASEKSSGVQVEFTNATESDVAYYEVERSSDGKLFSTIKKLNPTKNNYGSVAYSWVDATAREGRNIYRIKAVEIGGKTVYSSLVSITLGTKNSDLSVYSKGGQVALQVSSLPAGKYQVQLFNSAGQLLGVENISHGGGSISQTTSFSSAKAGIYILNINGAVRMQQKFMIQ